MASARLFFNYGNSNSRFPPLSACPVLPRTRGISLIVSEVKLVSFMFSQLVGETSRDTTAHPCQDGEEGINAVKKRHIGGNVSVVRK